MGLEGLDLGNKTVNQQGEELGDGLVGRELMLEMLELGGGENLAGSLDELS